MPDDSFTNKLINAQGSKTNAKVKNDLDRIHCHYRTGLIKHLGDLSASINLLLVLEYTILYIESNIKQFADAVGCPVSSDFKLDVALTLLLEEEDINSHFPSDFLEASITFLVHLLCPHEVKPSVDVQPKPERRMSIASKVSTNSVGLADHQPLMERRPKKYEKYISLGVRK